VQEIITDFFVQETCIFSGQNSNLWRLLKQKKELRFRFIATYPQLLRVKAVNHPELLAPTSPLTKVYTKLQASTLGARWAAQQVVFDELQEHDTRRAEAEAADLEERVAKRLARLGIRAKALKGRPVPSVSVDMSVAAFDASTEARIRSPRLLRKRSGRYLSITRFATARYTTRRSARSTTSCFRLFSSF
jgi:hypothetical protein